MLQLQLQPVALLLAALLLCWPERMQAPASGPCCRLCMPGSCQSAHGLTGSPGLLCSSSCWRRLRPRSRGRAHHLALWLRSWLQRLGQEGQQQQQQLALQGAAQQCSSLRAWEMLCCWGRQLCTSPTWSTPSSMLMLRSLRLELWLELLEALQLQEEEEEEEAAAPLLQGAPAPLPVLQQQRGQQLWLQQLPAQPPPLPAAAAAAAAAAPCPLRPGLPCCRAQWLQLRPRTGARPPCC